MTDLEKMELAIRRAMVEYENYYTNPLDATRTKAIRKAMELIADELARAIPQP